MEEDRRWLGRYNRAKWIQKLADDEHGERHEEVRAWYEERVKANAEFLIDAAAQGTLMSPPSVRHVTFGSEEADEPRDMVDQCFKKNWPPSGSWRTALFDRRRAP